MGSSIAVPLATLGAGYLATSLYFIRRPRTRPEPRMRRSALIAHRGGAAEGYENTLSAFRRAVSAGADMLELDVHLTRDGKVVGPAGTPGQVLLSWLYSARLCCAGIQPTDPECEQGGRGPVQLQVGPAHCSVVLTPSLCRAENRAAVRETPPVTLGVHGQLQLKATLHFGF